MLAVCDWTDCTNPSKQRPWSFLRAFIIEQNRILASLHRLSVSKGSSLSRNTHTHTQLPTTCRQPGDKTDLNLCAWIWVVVTLQTRLPPVPYSPDIHWYPSEFCPFSLPTNSNLFQPGWCLNIIIVLPPTLIKSEHWKIHFRNKQHRQHSYWPEAPFVQPGWWSFLYI